MGIEEKRRGQKLCKIKIDVYQTITSEGPRQINTPALEIFMPSELDSEKFKNLERKSQDCHVKLTLEHSVAVKFNQH